MPGFFFSLICLVSCPPPTNTLRYHMTLSQWNCHVSKTTFQTGLRFQTGLSSLRVSRKCALSISSKFLMSSIFFENKTRKLKKINSWYSKKKKSTRDICRDLVSWVTRNQELDRRNYVFQKFPISFLLFFDENNIVKSGIDHAVCVEIAATDG